MHDLVPLMDNCITITPGILNGNYIISEHIYIYGFINQIVLYVYIAQIIQCYAGAIFHPKVYLI